MATRTTMVASALFVLSLRPRCMRSSTEHSASLSPRGSSCQSSAAVTKHSQCSRIASAILTPHLNHQHHSRTVIPHVCSFERDASVGACSLRSIKAGVISSWSICRDIQVDEGLHSEVQFEVDVTPATETSRYWYEPSTPPSWSAAASSAWALESHSCLPPVYSVMRTTSVAAPCTWYRLSPRGTRCTSSHASPPLRKTRLVGYSLG